MSAPPEDLSLPVGVDVFAVKCLGRDGKPNNDAIYRSYELSWRRQIYQDDQQIANWTPEKDEKLLRESYQSGRDGQDGKSFLLWRIAIDMRAALTRGITRRLVTEKVEEFNHVVQVHRRRYAEMDRSKAKVEEATQALAELESTFEAHAQRFRDFDAQTATPEELCARIYHLGVLLRLCNRSLAYQYGCDPLC